MRLGTIIELSDGRRGTICYHNLDGDGGIWGEHDMSGYEMTFNDDLPIPQFMLREAAMQERFGKLWRAWGYDSPDCVGTEYTILPRLDEREPTSSLPLNAPTTARE